MGTLVAKYGDETVMKLTLSTAPVIAYGGATLVNANSWTGTKTLNCADQWLLSDIKVGDRYLSTKHMWAKADIKITYTKETPTSPTVVTTSKTITVPAGYNRVQFFAVGGGGAGGYILSLTKGAQACGGGGGYTKEVTLTTSPGTAYTLSVGPGASSPGGTGTASQVLQGSTVVLTAAGGTGATYYYYESSYDSDKDSYTGYAGYGGSGGGKYKDNTSGAAGGTNGGDGVNAYQNTDGTVKRGKGQGTTTKCSFVTNSPAYGAGGGGSLCGTSYASGYITTVDNKSYSGSTLSECLAQSRQNALSSSLYALLAGGATGGGHGGCWYRAGKRFDSTADGDPRLDYVSGYISCTSGTAGTGGGGGGGFYFSFDPPNGSSAQMRVTSGSGGNGAIIYRFYEA